jgi:hypothetical protein
MENAGEAETNADAAINPTTLVRDSNFTIVSSKAAEQRRRMACANRLHTDCTANPQHALGESSSRRFAADLYRETPVLNYLIQSAGSASNRLAS